MVGLSDKGISDTQLGLIFQISSIQFSLLCHVWLCDPMDCSTPGFPVQHQLPELAQTQIHPVGDAIQSSHPLSSPSPPAFNQVFLNFHHISDFSDIQWSFFISMSQILHGTYTKKVFAYMKFKLNSTLCFYLLNLPTRWGKNSKSMLHFWS